MPLDGRYDGCHSGNHKHGALRQFPVRRIGAKGLSVVARAETQQDLQPSLLDRLTDPRSEGSGSRTGYTLEQLLQKVQDDLADLLNTYASYYRPKADYPEVFNSIVAYGLPDLASMQAMTPEQREQISRELQGVVERFEPRLKDVKARLLEPGEEAGRTIRFRIDATLRADPAPAVAFETILELATGRYAVQQGGG
jgi:type VI secretion system protein ImpF